MAINLVDSTVDTTGRFFIVGNSTLPQYNEVSAMYGTWIDGSPVLYTTLTLALAKCVANRGDVIYIMPGHAETIVAAAGVAVSVAGVNIVGLGNGTLRPTYTFTTSVSASLDFTAANTLVRNIRFVTGIDNQTAVNNVTGADVTFDQCEWVVSNGTVGAALGILTAATADRLKVTNSRFIGPAINAGTTLAAAIQHESGVDYVFDNNFISAKATQGIKNVATVLRGRISNNIMVIGTGAAAITMAAASTPMIVNNRFNTNGGASTTVVVAAAGFVVGNAYSAAAGVTAGVASTF